MTGEKRGDVIRKDTDVHTSGPARREKDVVTAGSEDSFPASSDPPSYGGAIAGSPASHPPTSEPPTPQPPAKRGGPGKDKAGRD